MEGPAAVQRTIDELSESIQRDRRKLSRDVLQPQDRAALQRSLDNREGELRRLIETKWAILKVADNKEAGA
jgi:hypothetical protein